MVGCPSSSVLERKVPQWARTPACCRRPISNDRSAAGDIDTVIVAFCDMQGRLTGKRVSARLFVEDVAEHGAECCNYLLAVDVDMNTVDGYAISSWETGYGDMVMTPDFSTLRLLPWLPGTALVMADLSWTDGKPVKQAPRSILNRQIDRLAERGLVPYVGTELEFMVFDDRLPGSMGKRLPRTDAGHRLQRRLRDACVDPDGAAAARHPAREWTAPGCTARASRASATSASRRSRSATTTHGSPVTTTRSTRTAPKRSPTSTARA